jgi:vanillate O-demethylase ferredoxin subunit
MKVKVNRKEMIAEGIMSIELASVDGVAMPRFTAGAHIDVMLNDNLVRQYSLYNDADKADVYRIAVLREPNSRGGSIAMHDVSVGNILEISVPRNNFPLADEAEHTILLAGGIGITPILCMAERLIHVRASFELHYSARELTRAAFRDRLIMSDMRGRAHTYIGDSPEDTKARLKKILAIRTSKTHLYVCGPAGFIDGVLSAAMENGWPEDCVHREYFATTNTKNTNDKPFQIKIASDGRIVDVPANQSALKALSDAGINVLASCEQGICGTCLTSVLCGKPDHRDVYLTDQERASNRFFLPCCSRSKDDILVLDL